MGLLIRGYYFNLELIIETLLLGLTLLLINLRLIILVIILWESLGLGGRHFLLTWLWLIQVFFRSLFRLLRWVLVFFVPIFLVVLCCLWERLFWLFLIIFWSFLSSFLFCILCRRFLGWFLFLCVEIGIENRRVRGWWLFHLGLQQLRIFHYWGGVLEPKDENWL